MNPDEDEKSSSEVSPKSKKTKGRRQADISGLPVIIIDHQLTEDELVAEFGENGWYQMEDEIYNRYRFVPMKVELEEHHVGVCK